MTRAKSIDPTEQAWWKWSKDRQLFKDPDSMPRSMSEKGLAVWLIGMLTNDGVPPMYHNACVWAWNANLGVWEVLSLNRMQVMVLALDGLEYETGETKRNGEPKTKILYITHSKMQNVANMAVAMLRCESELSLGAMLDAIPGSLALDDGVVWSNGNTLVFTPYQDQKGWRFFPRSRFDFAFGDLYHQAESHALSNKSRLWDQYLMRSFDGDSQADLKIEAIEGFIGLCLMGMGTRFQKAFVLLGKGGSGKSVLIDIVTTMFKEHQQCSLNPQSMGNDQKAQMLSTALINIVDDMENGNINLTGNLKSIITGGKITVRKLYSDPESIKPVAGHIFAANKMPFPKDRSSGFYRRWCIVSMNNVIPRDERIPDYHEHILEEDKHYIIYRCLSAARRILHQGQLPMLQDSEDMVKSWKMESDSVGLWAEETIEIIHGPDSKESTSQDWMLSSYAFKSYDEWCDSNNHRACSSTEFKRRMKEMCTVKRTKRGVAMSIALQSNQPIQPFNGPVHPPEV